MRNLFVAACLALSATPVVAAPGDGAIVGFMTADGWQAGHAIITEQDGSLIIKGQIEGDVSRGPHGIHIHTVGKCDAPFDSAGGHFNPTGKKHGHANAEGPHAGDLSNVDITANGSFELLAKGVTLDQTLLDADGASIIIHAGPDDDKTDPSGNSGARLLCGVIQRKLVQ